MAWKKTNTAKPKNKNKRTEVERTAFLMGQVERGRKNPDSRITESFNNGKKESSPTKKKSLF